MLNNTKGLHTVETPAAEPSAPTVAGPNDNCVFLCGEWHERRADWRDDVDLATCDNMIAYAAGRLDGHRQAMSEFYEMWKLLRPFYEYMGKPVGE
jgi:hypothetical protein